VSSRHRELEGDQLKGPRYPGRASAGCSRFDWVTSARPDPQLAKQQPANGPNHANGEEFENASLLQNADEDLDGDSRQEREDRAKHGSRDNRPHGPGWETVHVGPAR